MNTTIIFSIGIRSAIKVEQPKHSTELVVQQDLQPMLESKKTMNDKHFKNSKEYWINLIYYESNYRNPNNRSMSVNRNDEIAKQIKKILKYKNKPEHNVQEIIDIVNNGITQEEIKSNLESYHNRLQEEIKSNLESYHNRLQEATASKIRDAI
jgi:hypothetical protein